MTVVYLSSAATITERRANVIYRWEYNGNVLYFYVHNGYSDQDVEAFWNAIPPETPVIRSNGTQDGIAKEYLDAYRKHLFIKMYAAICSATSEQQLQDIFDKWRDLEAKVGREVTEAEVSAWI